MNPALRALHDQHGYVLADMVAFVKYVGEYAPRGLIIRDRARELTVRFDRAIPTPPDRVPLPPEPQPIDCQECGGTGSFCSDDRMDGEYLGIIAFHECRRCDGTGRVQ